MVSTQGVKGKSSESVTGLQRDAKTEKEGDKSDASTSADGKKGATKKSTPSSKVSISEDARKLAQKGDAASAQGEDDQENDPVLVEKKKNDLVNFYAKQLMKATDKLEKETSPNGEESSVEGKAEAKADTKVEVKA